jgi:hypothetical protein
MEGTLSNPGRELMQINDNSSPKNMDIRERTDICFMTPLRLYVLLLTSSSIQTLYVLHEMFKAMSV